MEERRALKFLRIAGSSLLYSVIVFSVCTSIFLFPVSKETLMFFCYVYAYIFYITVTASSLYLGYWLTRRHCKYFAEFLTTCIIHTVVSTLALVCTLYVIFFLMDLMIANGRADVFTTVRLFSFSGYKFAFISPISFFLGGGFYWLYHRREDDT